MEIKVPSESEAVSLPDCESDPEEQEFSDDDDDRNHKHRRREASSQSLERDQPEQFLNGSYRKRGRPFENGNLSKGSEPQSHYNMDREFPSKFGQRRPSMAKFSQFHSDANQRFKPNQFSGDLGTGRGRIRNPGPWNHRDLRFTGMDIASQFAPPGPIPPAVFAGRGLHSVPTAQNSSWAGGFGLIPGIPTGPIDPIHPLGLQATFRPPLNPSLNMGIPRQRCRDFEERGFCLRGDMCPMEHGVNRIVVEDVQSLSQFNLPASLPSAHLLGNPGGSGLGPPVNASSSALINSKDLSSRANGDANYTLGGAPTSVVDGSGPDVYDPDQPLWNSDCPQTSTAIISLQTPTTAETESYMEGDPSDQPESSRGAATGLQNTSSSVWGRMNPSKNKMESGGRVDSRGSPSMFPESRSKEKGEIYTSAQGASHHGKRSNTGELNNSSFRVQNDTGRSMRNPTQKAMKTLFVNCIPLKDNRKEVLLNHFKKFGEVIYIRIPPYTEQAFVQFSKREEAERALRSPDAVMGNRFIKLWWANRDNIVDDSIVGGNSVPGMHQHISEATVPLRPPNANTSKENIQLSVPKASAPYNTKPPATNGTKVLTEPSVQKKENLELLKEELRKKQEMLERKRNEFRLQLDKLQKHGKGEAPEVQAAKKLKVEGADDSLKQLDLHASSTNLLAEVSLQKSQPVENEASHSSKTKLSAPMLDLSNSKHAAHSPVHVGSPFPTNRYKLDNRPTSFKINAPLPTEFAKVNALRDHFAVFGDVSNIELEDSEVQRGPDDNCSEIANNVSACVSFKTRQAAEKAFINGKSWNGHSLQFTWLIPSKPSSNQKEKSKSPASGTQSGTEIQPLKKPANTNPQDSSGEKGSSVSAAKDVSGTEVQSAEKVACDISQDSCGGSQTSAPGLTSSLGAEAQSADKSASNSSQEAKGEPGSTDTEAAEKEGATHGGMELDDDFKPNKDPAIGDTQHTQEDVC